MKERGAGGKKKEAQINKRSTFLSGSLKLADSREPTVFVLKSPNRNNGLAGWIMKKTTAKEGGQEDGQKEDGGEKEKEKVGKKTAYGNVTELRLIQ